MKVMFERVRSEDCESLTGEIVLGKWNGAKHMRLSAEGKHVGVLLPATPGIKQALSYSIAFGFDPETVSMLVHRLPNAGTTRVYLVTEFKDEKAETLWTAGWDGQDGVTIHDSLGQAMQSVLSTMEDVEEAGEVAEDEVTPDEG